MSDKPLALIREKDGIRGLVPAPRKGRDDKAYVTYLNSIHPRENHDLQIALAQSDDNRFLEFLDRIKANRYRKSSLATIAKACGISLKDFNEWWQKASSQRSIAAAQNASIQVTHDMAIDALSTNGACPRCDGLGWVSAPSGLPEFTKGYREIGTRINDKNIEEPMWARDCPNCNTAGVIRKPGDSHARDKILTMAGVLPTSKGIAIVQNFGGVSHGSAVAELSSMDIIDLTPEKA